MDRRCIPITLGGVFVRRGNFFNYEIVGKPHDLPWAVKFIKMDREYGKLVPRHTTQLYESLADRSRTLTEITAVNPSRKSSPVISILSL